jgi:uncharacterized protein with GYD domain
MSTFVMITRLSHDALSTPSGLKNTVKDVMQRIRDHCQGVKWTASYAVLGPADLVDIFEAPSVDEAAKVAAIVRTFGHATTEIWPATSWDSFLKTLGSLPPGRIEV